ncbi:hypothetical protein [Rhodococcoides corynebacterioides]|nr:hypothetical protein [Rhodococcus corynebacterioides]
MTDQQARFSVAPADPAAAWCCGRDDAGDRAVVGPLVLTAG